jgi:hypothetical protein
MNPNSQMLSPTNLHVETTFLVGERKNSQKSNHSFHIISSLSINKTQLTQKINKHKLIKNNKNPKLRSPKLHLLTHKLPNQAGEKKNPFSTPNKQNITKSTIDKNHQIEKKTKRKDKTNETSQCFGTKTNTSSTNSNKIRHFFRNVST